MNTAPFISVIIPARNEESYIRETLARVMVQRGVSSYEIIVVDNGSEDRTAEYARSFAGVSVLKEFKSGVQFARELGRKHARGQILAFLDADTIPPPDWLSKGAAYFSREDVVAVSGPCNFYDVSLLARFLASVFFNYRWGHLIVHNVLRRGGVMAGGNAFIRSSALEAIGGFNLAIEFYGDDTDTARRLARIGKILYRGDVRVETSARRFKKLGFLKVMRLYTLNFAWVILFGKPFTRSREVKIV